MGRHGFELQRGQIGPARPRRIIQLNGQRSSAAELADDAVPLDACRGDGDLPPDKSVLARVDGPQKSVEPRHLRHESHGAAHGRAGGLVRNPDQVRPLARNGHPAARFTHDLDQQSPHRAEKNESRTVESEYPPSSHRQRSAWMRAGTTKRPVASLTSRPITGSRAARPTRAGPRSTGSLE